MRIYARKTLFPINGEEMFRVTRVGMKAYKEFFGRAYPFGKYDQVFVPEHNYGAMENVCCVTYNEAYLFKGQTPSLAKRLQFSNTNLHELAHMWFGNLVTMEWWNDLWLNESFATYMAFLIEATAEELSYFDTVWVSYLRYSFWGVQTDSLSSTHPITCEIASTDQAVSIFDGISYGKGSAWLK
jgi:aminopeptidase N